MTNTDQVIVRIGSHRANYKLKRAVPNAVEVYENSFTVSGYFAVVPLGDAHAALAIAGISKVRDQNPEHYSKTISMG